MTEEARDEELGSSDGELGSLGSSPQGSQWRALAVVFIAMVILQLVLHWRSTLYDTDSYVHLAMARMYAEQGIPADLDAARFSVMHEGFGDKEWLFHALLAPLVMLLEPLLAGRVALALLNGLIAVSIASWARFAVGRWGLLLPFLLPIASTEFFWRSVRLRPELLALSLLLWALMCLADRRPKLLGLCMLLFTWGYTAFHALLGVLLLSWLVMELVRRGPRTEWSQLGRSSAKPNSGWPSWDWKLALYPVLGAGLGLVLHPHFPHNLVVWLIQNVQFFFAKSGLDAGTEILPNTTDVMLFANLGFWLFLLILWRGSGRGKLAHSTTQVGAVAGNTAKGNTAKGNTAKGSAAKAGRVKAAEAEVSKHRALSGTEQEQQDRTVRRTIVIGVAASVFTVLYLLMSRFSIYAMPLLALWFIYGLRGHKATLARWVKLPFGRRVSMAWALLLCLAVCVPGITREVSTYRQRTDPGPDNARLSEWQELSAVIPKDARVAADWRATGVLMLWAPQGSYLNVLDPVFMATPYPQQHAVLSSVLNGSEPDVPTAVTQGLNSEYLLVRTVGANPLLMERLLADPRSEIVFQGSYLAVRFRPAPDVFLSRGWRGVGATRVKVAAASAAQGGRNRMFEGYVDGEQFAFVGPCMTLENSVKTTLGAKLQLTLSARGTSSLWFDGKLLVRHRPGVEAVLGRGVKVEVQPSAGTHQILVQSCRTEEGSAPGFYLEVAELQEP